MFLNLKYLLNKIQYLIKMIKVIYDFLKPKAQITTLILRY